MKPQEMPGQKPEKTAREKYREEYEETRKKIFRDYTGEERDDYDLAQFDVLSMDTDRALACYETFYDPDSVWGARDIITQSRNEVVKLEVAKRLNPVSNIVGLYEDYKLGRLDDIKYQIVASRTALEEMIKSSESETRIILQEKLQQFEEAVSKFELPE